MLFFIYVAICHYTVKESCSMKKRKSIPYVLVAAGLVIVFALWYSWMSYSTAKTDFVEKRVRSFIKSGLDVVVYLAPRSSWSINNGPTFYAADLSHDSVFYSQQQKVYDILLESVQSDDIPPCKIQPVLLHCNMPDISASACVTFELAPGIYKTIVVKEDTRTPLFKSPTGEAVEK